MTLKSNQSAGKRCYSTWGAASSSLVLESRISDETIRELRLREHPVTIAPGWEGTVGHAQAIRIDRATGFFEDGADPRGDGAAMGFWIRRQSGITVDPIQRKKL